MKCLSRERQRETGLNVIHVRETVDKPGKVS